MIRCFLQAARRSVARLLVSGAVGITLGSALVAGGAAQAQQAPANSGAAAASASGPASANIFEVQPGSQAERQVTQPLNNAPLWRDVNSGKEFYTTLPKNEGGRLIQQEGEEWRQLRNGPVIQYGGWWLVAVLLAIAAFYLYRGPIRVSEPPTGRLIERFTVVERGVHWINASCFVVLALTGLTLLFGKYVLLPVFGYTLFSWIAALSKTVHNFLGPLFAVTVLILMLTFIRDNFPRAGDLGWLAKGGGLLTRRHLPSGRFNAGEKVLFWGGVVLLGVLITISGLVMNFPNFGQTRGLMQFSWTVHVITALLFVALILGHIYIGTIGTEGALTAMKTGYVDEAWAKEHHEYWYDDIKAGKIPAQRSAEPVPPDARAGAQRV